MDAGGALCGAQQRIALAGRGEGLVVAPTVIVNLGDGEAGAAALFGVARLIGDDRRSRSSSASSPFA
jgi:hypothetical protein